MPEDNGRSCAGRLPLIVVWAHPSSAHSDELIAPELESLFRLQPRLVPFREQARIPRATDSVQQTTCNRQRATDNETTWYTASGGCGVPFGQAGAGTNRPTGMRRSVRHVRIGCVCRLVQHCHVADCAAYNLQQHATTCDNMQQHVACMPQPAWDCRQHGGRVRGCPCGYPHTNPEGNCSVALQRIATPPSVEGRPCGRCVGRGAS